MATNPTYRSIGDHTEAIEVDFDPEIISFGEILSVVWESHHPLKNFGGRQYRHAIWYQNDEQRIEAESSREAVALELQVPVEKIQTSLEAAGEFTYAEDYHQKYVLRRQKRIIGKLEDLFSDYLAFTDSAVMSRLNGWFGNGSAESASSFREEVLSFGLPSELQARILTEI